MLLRAERHQGRADGRIWNQAKHVQAGFQAGTAPQENEMRQLLTGRPGGWREMTEIEAVEAGMVRRIKAAVRRIGPLTWRQARQAAGADGLGDRFDNERLLRFVAAGHLRVMELPDGDSLLTV